jgi:uncharacterized FAD-dependent dehydrogenase
MSLRIREIALSLDDDESLLPAKIAARLRIPSTIIKSWKIKRKGIDARKKPKVLRVYTVDFECDDEAFVLEQNKACRQLEVVTDVPAFEISRVENKKNVMVVGMGPAGLFAALALAEAGMKVKLIERGRALHERICAVRDFWDHGIFDSESNIQFGEGGAGTFSDGKLTSRIGHPAMNYVLKRFVEFGAPEEILFQAKPHVGSDRLRNVLMRLREHLLALGVEISFSSRLSGIESHKGRVVAAIVNDKQRHPCDELILAVGHSARDTYAMLVDRQVAMEQKAFAIGLRVEHPLELINQIQYSMREHAQLPAADYRLAWNDPHSGRGVYSFCMCPGGVVINAASEDGGIVVNGMSPYKRNEPWSNSALVVSVTPADFGTEDLLAGVQFQRRWEQAAYNAGEKGWRAPAQPMLEFLNGDSVALAETSCRPEVVHADLSTCLPPFVSAALRQALPQFNRKMRGFVGPEATLIGVETRTSAPLRILRNKNKESFSHQGLYPCGEGAGYAGGIMSAAVDGISTAHEILQREQ